MPTITNPNITPAGGLVEGDLFELLMLPKDEDEVSQDLSAIVLSIQNGDTTDVVGVGDLYQVTIDSIEYDAYSWVVGPGKTQIQGVSTGTVVATDLAYIKATKRPI